MAERETLLPGEGTRMRIGRIIIGLVVVATVATSIALLRPEGAPASGSGPGMSLSGASAVSTGETFTIEINADPPPGVPIGGFASEVQLPPGLSWVQRPTCGGENQTRVDGGAVGNCVRAAGPNGEARHVVVSGIQQPPLPALDAPLVALLEIDVLCTAPGVHSLTLTAVPQSSFGAVYFATDTNTITAKTNAVGAADTIVVTCAGTALPASATPTGTATATPLATYTPGPSPTCPHELPPGDDMCLVLDSDPGSHPGMSLSGPGTVSTGQTFAIDINANPPPGAAIAGFASEVLFPPGLRWVQRPMCEDENQTTVNGGNVAACVRASGPDGEARHYTVSSIQAPPLAALDTPLGALMQLDVLCTAPGTHTMTLTAVSNSPTSSSFGAIYFDISTQQVLVKTEPYDIDGNTDVEQVADTLTVDCAGTPLPTTPCPGEGCPTPTPTRTRIPTYTPTGPPPTPTPCAPEGCPTHTPSPTLPPPPTPTPCDLEGCPPPGMTLSGPSYAYPNTNFTLRISASPSPAVGIGGFATEIALPSGLKWEQRSTCRDEVLARVNGVSPGTCVRATGPNHEVRHLVITSIAAPPLQPLDSPVTSLIEIAVRCNTPGVHTLVLTAVPESSFGAVLFDINTLPIELATTPYDVDGDTVMEYVADTLTVNCSPLVTSTPSSSPTSTPTPCPTDTGPLDGECAPHTPTPVVETPAGETPEETTDAPAPSPTLFSEVDPAPAVVTPTETDFSEVSPALATPAGTALDDLQSPDAGDGAAGSDNGASLGAIGLLVATLFALGAASLRRLGRMDERI